ncbi:MAG TPA: hypothetical protein VFC78_20390 [Tepidisphaeraceae bacterium]|nr:hypothetical protein [Tepidisphaeraceae bacterium]
MNHDYEKMSAFEQIKGGLQDGIAHARGELTLNTTVLPKPAPPMSKAKIARLRKNLRMSQRLFAAALNVSAKLVQSWEQGSRPGHVSHISSCFQNQLLHYLNHVG